MDKVNFTRMELGTAEEYAFLDQLEEQFKADLPKRLIERLKSLIPPYQVIKLVVWNIAYKVPLGHTVQVRIWKW